MKQSEFLRFDMKKKPCRQLHVLRPITWIMSFPEVWKNKTKIEKIQMDNIKPPYLLLCNHNAFADFKVATAAMFPARANYVVAIDGFIKREWLLRKVGCICKRKFTNDVTLVRQLKRVIANGDIAVLYPEARYSLCGTTAVLPESLGKLAKFLDVPVVTLIVHGHHIKSPFWHLKKRGDVPVEAEMTCILTKEELKALTAEQINERIHNAFVYDEFAWQKQRNIKISSPDRAEGLHKVLYQCPNCKTEYKMESSGTQLHCTCCDKRWDMTELGELCAVDGVTEFSHIPDWYEWERNEVQRQILDGTYSVKLKAAVDSLPNSKGYVPLGDAELTHDCNGFRLCGCYEGEPYTVERPVKSMYSLHIEYDYLGCGKDCIDLNTLTDTYYIYPYGDEFSVTKMALATEELFYSKVFPTAATAIADH